MTDQTPSPQSVVVPVEPTPKMLAATWDHEIDKRGGIESQNTRNARIWSAMLAAAPAPSSLAGGEVTDEWADRFCEAVNWSPDGQECKTVEGELRCTTFRQIAKGHILSAIATNPYPDNAALSPEAPALEGVDAVLASRVAATMAALTPRHEAPASPAWRDEYNRVEAIREAAEGQDRVARSTADPIAKSDAETQAAGHWTRYEREVAKLNAASGHEAPAEGAGEALDRLAALCDGNNLGPIGMNSLRSVLAALRTRSSAPQAREATPKPEPVAYQRRSPLSGWVSVDAEDVPHYRGRGQEIRALGVIE